MTQNTMTQNLKNLLIEDVNLFGVGDQDDVISWSEQCIDFGSDDLKKCVQEMYDVGLEDVVNNVISEVVEEVMGELEE